MSNLEEIFKPISDTLYSDERGELYMNQQNQSKVTEIIDGPEATIFKMQFLDTSGKDVYLHQYMLRPSRVEWDTACPIYGTTLPLDAPYMYKGQCLPFFKIVYSSNASDFEKYMLADATINTAYQFITKTASYMRVHELTENDFYDSCWEFLLKKYKNEKRVKFLHFIESFHYGR